MAGRRGREVVWLEYLVWWGGAVGFVYGVGFVIRSDGVGVA